MKKVNIFSFWTLLTLGMATVMLNSCTVDLKNPEKETPTIAVTDISLDRTAFTLAVGEEYPLLAIVSPYNATNKEVTWTSSDESKATVSNGIVTAKYAGEVIITAEAGDRRATCTIMVTDPLAFDAGEVINGVRWATRNVDAPGRFVTNVEDLGMFYQWNRSVAWTIKGDVIDWDTIMPAGDRWEKVNDPSPAGWHVPTLSDIEKLLDTKKVKSEWVLENGVIGRKFTDLITKKSIFLPAAGYRDNDGILHGVDTQGIYWSGTAVDVNDIYWSSMVTVEESEMFGSLLKFSIDEASKYINYRRFGFNIRCVAN